MTGHARHSGLALLLALTHLACADAPPEGAVIVLIDTLRADRVGAPRLSPNLDALAAEGVRFEHAMAPAPWTLPSVATLMTSLHPTVHGASTHSRALRSRQPDFHPASRLDERFETLAEVFAQAGFATAAVVEGAYPSRVYGMSQGFDHFVDNRTHGTRFSIEEIFRWLDAERPERFLVYLHTIDVHSPYAAPALYPFETQKLSPGELEWLVPAVAEETERFRALDPDPEYSGPIDGTRRSIRSLRKLRDAVPPAERKRLVELYDTGVAYTDYWMGELASGLRERGLLDRIVLLVTSDHGEEFWEHGGLEHGRTVFEEQLHIPLLIRGPGIAAGRVVDEPVGLIDVLPTLLDLFGIEERAAHQGRSLRPLWQGVSGGERSYYAEAARLHSLALRRGRWKLILGASDGARLYDLVTDPGETRDVCPLEPEICRHLRGKATAWQAEARRAAGTEPPPAAEPDEETLERLRELGYLDPE